jgi:hypothetical protein
MKPEIEVDYILHDCFFAVGQALGPTRRLSREAIVWWRRRYREMFVDALTRCGNSWACDRDRVMAVGRLLGEYAMHHAGEREEIDWASAVRASADVERGCRMNAQRESGLSRPASRAS